MSILTDTDLNQILRFDENQWNQEKANTLLIKDGSDKCITPMGYDLRVGGFYKTLINKPNLVSLDNQEKKKIVIKPGDIALIGTFEKVKLPQDGSISALILSRVSQVSKGLSNISTKVDPGWSEGELLIPVQNYSRDTIELKYQEKLCTIVFFKNESSSTEKYNSSSSREKFFKLLAQTRRKSLLLEIVIAAIPIPVTVCAFLIGYNVFGASAGLTAILIASSTISSVVSAIVSKFFGRI